MGGPAMSLLHTHICMIAQYPYYTHTPGCWCNVVITYAHTHPRAPTPTSGYLCIVVITHIYTHLHTHTSGWLANVVIGHTHTPGWLCNIVITHTHLNDCKMSV